MSFLWFFLLRFSHATVGKCCVASVQSRHSDTFGRCETTRVLQIKDKSSEHGVPFSTELPDICFSRRGGTERSQANAFNFTISQQLNREWWWFFSSVFLERVPPLPATLLWEYEQSDGFGWYNLTKLTSRTAVGGWLIVSLSKLQSHLRQTAEPDADGGLRCPLPH